MTSAHARFGTTDKRPRVTLDRQSSTSEIWHLGGVKFHENCGLWFAAKFDAEETQTQIETILHVYSVTRASAASGVRGTASLTSIAKPAET